MGATIAALKYLGDNGINGRLLLIAGGESKGQDFTPLALSLVTYNCVLLLIGRDADIIRSAVEASTKVMIISCSTLTDAVRHASKLACPSDVILLSPACSSFDMFQNYSHRGEVFINAIHGLSSSYDKPKL